ncbi:MAG: VWA domain-containing protein [Rhodobacteraceae bacterium]|nr:MAG: VWA domain-containing protein [Paracoccaceae bacterium]
MKRFSDPMDAATGAALSGLRPGYSTRLGAALRHAGRDLGQVPRHRRLLLLITDGEPSDIDTPDPEYLVRDAQRAVRSLSAMGIDVFCVGPGPRNKEQEAAIFGRNGFIQIDTLNTLPDKLLSFYLRLTR